MKLAFGGEARGPKTTLRMVRLGGGLSIRLRGSAAAVMGSEKARPPSAQSLAGRGPCTGPDAPSRRDPRRGQSEG